MNCRLLFHVHTRRSVDAWITPSQIVKHARAYGIDIVIVTDHDSHLGSLECAELVGDDPPSFPLSAEYRSSAGDIIASFLTSPVRSRDPRGIIDETHEQGGIVILPHPLKGSRFSDDLFESADMIETFNARCSDNENARASEIARALSKPEISGADAHFADELGLVLNEFLGVDNLDRMSAMLTAPRTFITAKTSIRSIRRSQMLKACRQVRPVTFGKNLVRWMQASSAQTP